VSFEVSFAVAEQALKATYRIAAKDSGRFRGRWTALQRGGLFGPELKPGKGRHLRYNPDMLHRLIFALELAAANVTPAVQLGLVRDRWEARLTGIFRAAEDAAEREPGDADIILIIGGMNFMAGSWSGEATAASISHCRLGNLAARLIPALRPYGPADKLLPRALAINLTARLRTFHACLVEAHDLREPVMALEKKNSRTARSPRPAAGKPKRRKRTA
jgi:hypothetical protein